MQRGNYHHGMFHQSGTHDEMSGSLDRWLSMTTAMEVWVTARFTMCMQMLMAAKTGATAKHIPLTSFQHFSPSTLLPSYSNNHVVKPFKLTIFLSPKLIIAQNLLKS